MGKGDKRRKFDKKLDRAFKKRYRLAYRPTDAPKSDTPRTIYVVQDDGTLVPKESRCSG